MRKKILSLFLMLWMGISMLPCTSMAIDSAMQEKTENSVQVTCVEAPQPEEPVEEIAQERQLMMPRLRELYLSDFKTTREELLQQLETAYDSGKSQTQIYYATETDMTPQQVESFGTELGLEAVKEVPGGQDCWVYKNYYQVADTVEGVHYIIFLYLRYAYATDAKQIAARIHPAADKVEVIYQQSTAVTAEDREEIWQEVTVSEIKATPGRYWQMGYAEVNETAIRLVFTPLATITNFGDLSSGENGQQVTLRWVSAEAMPDEEVTNLCYYLDKATARVATESEFHWVGGELTSITDASGVSYSLPMTAQIYYNTADALARQIRKAMVERQTPFTLGYTVDHELTKAENTALMTAAMVHTKTPTEGDYLRWQCGDCSIPTTGYSNEGTYYYTLTFQITPYYTTAAQEAEMDAFVEKFMNSEAMRNAVTDYQKVEVIYNWLCGNVHYDYDNLENESYKLKHTAYAAAIDHTAVCQGYAVLFYRLALECGIDARVITGKGLGAAGWENHAWNIVRLGDNDYLLDATWDAGKTLSSYQYFLKGSSDFAKHTADNEYRDILSHVSVTDYVPTDADRAVVVRGDLNKDGVCNAKDMEALYEYLSQGRLPNAYDANEVGFRALADVNEDGAVNILDYQCLYNWILVTAKAS